MVPDPDLESIEAVDLLVTLLSEPSTTLNCLKCLANLAVHPRARTQMRNTPDCISKLDDLCQSKTALIKKHANIAKQAVLWEP